MRGVYIQKKSPFYWIRYYDKLESDPRKRRKSINTKIEITEADKLRKKKGLKLIGTPELRRLVESFRLALTERTIERKIHTKLKKIKTLKEILIDYFIDNPQLAFKTKQAYRYAIDKFTKILDDKRIDKYTKEDYYNFLQKIKETNQNEATLSFLSRNLYVIFNYAKKNNYINEIVIKKLKAPRGIPQPIPLNDLKKILEYYKKKNNEQHYLFVYLMLYTGQRQSSLIKLKWSDIDFNNKFVLIHNVKGKKLFSFPLHSKLENLLKSIKPKGEYILQIKSFRFWQRDINKLLKEKIIMKKYTMYQLRDTFSTILAKGGADVGIVQELLNHSNINITKEHYLLIDNIMKKDIMEKIFKNL